MIQNIGSISKQTEYSIYVSTEWLGVYCLIFYVNNAIALWSIFRKAGKPGTLSKIRILFNLYCPS